ncbi:MAG: LamG-like jellyroll fold domain-containing protein, partial [Ferruginibacter sp.]
MRKLLLLPITICFLFSFFTANAQQANRETGDNPSARDRYAAELLKDPALGYVPYQRLNTAIEYTESLKKASRSSNTSSLTAAPLPWIERGPIYDSVGPSNGNTRGPGNTGGHTAGRMRGFLLDTLNDPSGNTAFASGVAGGIWKCTNFLTGGVAPNWVAINDRFSNLAISSICQDPINPQIIYFATGEPTDNADRVTGGGVWKSTNGGTTFTFLASTANYLRAFKISCDATGNVYLALRVTTIPVNQQSGLFRSTNGGTSWTDITPSDLDVASSNNRSCTDFEFTASGKLNAMFGYRGTVVAQRYSAVPATVTSATWSAGMGFRTSNLAAIRTEVAVVGELLYAVTANSGNLTDSCYKSTDGGATWTKQNTIIMPAGLAAQSWYNMSLTINPLNTNELITGALDAYRSIDGGATWIRMTYWVTAAPYVHADHHYAQYWISGAQIRLIMCNDGGVFYSNDNGLTFISKNRNLGIKQFYSAAIHPTAGSPYLLAGAQDNGTHALSNPGLSYSIEVTGGDGCIVHINQQNPLIQFGSYIYNQYRRSTNGGASWSSVNLSGTTGQFVNPFDYDDAQNIMYCGNSAGTIRRWDNANTSNTSSIVTVTNMTGSLLSVKYSPYTANTIFFGTNNGKLFRLDNANTAVSTAAVDITGASFPTGTIICVNTGTDDNNLVATYSNFGVNNVWVSTNGGTSWAAVDGNLPDMPVRWAMFEPGSNAKLYLATEAGIYTTTNINGASTVWDPETTFPTVSTYMLKMRASDSTIVAGTHGRGLWTAKIPAGTATNPTVTINQAAAQPDPTSVSPINFTVVFDQVVTGFATGDVVLTGTAGATTGTVTGSGTTYNVAVSGMTSSGTVIATIPAGVAINAISEPNLPSTSTDNTVTFNLTPNPNVTINQAAAQPDPTSVSPINFTVVFDQVVTGFATGDVTLSGTAGATVAVVTGSGTTYNVSVSGMTSCGTVIATIPAGVATNSTAQTNNASTSTDNTVTFTTGAAPSVTINQAAAQPDPTTVTPINFTVVFDQVVTGFATGDVTLSGTAGATTANVTGSGTTYNVAVSGMSASGTVIATIAAGVAQNACTQPNNASTSTDNTVTYTLTCTPPTVNPVPNQVLCAGASTNAVNFTSTPPGATFAWTNSAPSIGLAASGTGNIPSFVTVNNTAVPVVATITVTPTIFTGGGPSAPTPELLHYRFDGTGTSIPNLASAPPPGTATATIVGTHTQSGVGQCNTALVSTGGAGNYVNTGWATSFNSPFTISFWLGENQVDNNPSYLFGDVSAGSFRAFYGGAALGNNMLLRGGSGDVLITGVNPGATLVTVVYNGTNTTVYKNGVFFQTYAVTFNNSSAGPFRVGGYSSGTAYTGKMDEFRLYNRALSAAEVGTLTNCSIGGTPCVGPPSTFTITVNPNPQVVIIADPGTTICEGDPTRLTVVLGTATPVGTLYTQGTGAPANGSPSQVFEPANAAFSSQAADDFTVPAGATWTVSQITTAGIGAGTPTSVNVFFYNNSGSNLPGTVVASYNNVATYTRVGGNYTVTLPTALSLTAGTYWVSFQVNMSFATGGQWFWGNFGTTNIGNQYAWQNPGGGFATPCTSWGYGATGCAVGGGVNRNNVFSLVGTSITG